jgi:hypothetical protein
VYHHAFYLLRWDLVDFSSLDWPPPVIFLISASQVAEIRDRSHCAWRYFGFCPCGCHLIFAVWLPYLCQCPRQNLRARGSQSYLLRLCLFRQASLENSSLYYLRVAQVAVWRMDSPRTVRSAIVSFLVLGRGLSSLRSSNICSLPEITVRVLW